MESEFKKLRTLFIINNLPLLPCVLVTLWRISYKFIEVQYIWTREFLGLILPVIFLRIFFIPYISSAVIIFLYLRLLKKKEFPKHETNVFIVLLIICILGLVSVEMTFEAAMGI